MTRFFHLTMLAVVASVMAISLWGMRTTGISVSLAQLLPHYAVFGVLLLGAGYCRWRRLDRLVAPFLIVFWMGLVCQLHIFPMFVAAKQPAEFCDSQLAYADRLLGLEVPDLLHKIAKYPALREWLNVAYDSLNLFLGCALLATTLGNRLRIAQEYVIGVTLSAILSFPAFAMVQAIGPWSYFGLDASPSQWHYRQVLMALKESREYVIDLNYSEGLICFPSFHAILALLAAIALWQVRGFRWASAIWASMIVVSTVTTGWHYVVDILAGVAVVGISAVGAKAYTAFEVYWTKERAFVLLLGRRSPLAANTGFQIGRKG